jgi:uncharacterized membrane protein YdbT with pleckstrin-like domain
MPDLIVDPSEEQIILKTHKHWINVAPALMSFALVAVLIFLLPTIWLNSSEAQRVLTGSAMTALLTIGVSTSVVFGLLAYWVYSQNQLVLTTMYLVQVTQSGLFNRTVSRLSLDKLQEVTARQAGPLAQIFGFGDLVVETAGEQENFVFTQVPRAQDMAHRIMQAHESLEDRPKPVIAR